MLNILEFNFSIPACFNKYSAKILLDLLSCFLTTSSHATTRGLCRYSTYTLRTIFRFLAGTYDWISRKVFQG